MVSDKKRCVSAEEAGSSLETSSRILACGNATVLLRIPFCFSSLLPGLSFSAMIFCTTARPRERSKKVIGDNFFPSLRNTRGSRPIHKEFAKAYLGIMGTLRSKLFEQGTQTSTIVSGLSLDGNIFVFRSQRQGFPSLSLPVGCSTLLPNNSSRGINGHSRLYRYTSKMCACNRSTEEGWMERIDESSSSSTGSSTSSSSTSSSWKNLVAVTKSFTERKSSFQQPRAQTQHEEKQRVSADFPRTLWIWWNECLATPRCICSPCTGKGPASQAQANKMTWCFQFQNRRRFYAERGNAYARAHAMARQYMYRYSTYTIIWRYKKSIKINQSARKLNTPTVLPPSWTLVMPVSPVTFSHLWFKTFRKEKKRRRFYVECGNKYVRVHAMARQYICIDIIHTRWSEDIRSRSRSTRVLANWTLPQCFHKAELL